MATKVFAAVITSSPGKIPIDFREVYAFGGSLHCSTTDVYREGELQDYFPKQ